MIHLQAFNDFYNLLLNDFPSAALATNQGQLIHVKSADPVDYDSLWFSINTTFKYFQLGKKDLVILNDPYSGGTTLDHFTFVMTLTEPSRNSAGLRLAVRVRPEHRFYPESHIEKEGLRIPPTPIQQNGQINEVILNALSAHPQISEVYSSISFNDWIRKTAQDLGQFQQKFESLTHYYADYLNTDIIQLFINESKTWALKKMTEHPSGESRATLNLLSGELLTARMTASDEQIHIDFSGTSAGSQVFLNDAMTFGPCYEVICQHYGFPDLKNSGSFSVLKITKPSGCFVNAKFPSPTFKGHSIGAAALQYLTQMLIINLETKLKRSIPQFDRYSAALQFEKSQISFSLPSGSFAMDNANGQDALFGAHFLSELSVQEIENKYPLKILSLSPRENWNEANDKIKFHGGHGLVFKFVVTENSTFKISRLFFNTQWKCPSQMTLGEFSETLINNLPQANDKDIFTLKKNDQIEIRTSQGGHWLSRPKKTK